MSAQVNVVPQLSENVILTFKKNTVFSDFHPLLKLNSKHCTTVLAS